MISMPDQLTLASPEVFEARQQELGLASPWFREQQRAAWLRYQQLPYPTRRNEHWRFSNLGRVSDVESYAPVPMEGVEAAELVERSQLLDPVAGRMIWVDDNLAAPRVLAAGLEQQGVVFTTLIDALNKHPQLLEHYFMRYTPALGSEKFEALHVAMLRAGVVIYIPKGLQVTEPFVIHHWTQRAQGALFPHTLFICDEGASATVVEFQDHAQADTEHLVVANADVIAEAKARPRHVIVQNWNPRTLSFQLNTSNAQAHSDLKSVLINTGSRYARQEVHGRIFGSHSNVEIFSLGVPRGEQELDQRTLQTHIAPESRSDLLFKNALADDSHSIFSGLIIVKEDAQKTDAYQKNSNLMLSDTAEANSLPGLEIGANDVRCTHGATTGRIDESNLFYFLARGIPRATAEELLAFGFVDDIVAKIEHESLQELVRERVQAKFRA